MNSQINTYFGGPDLEKNALRNILLKHIQNVPANGHICWMCYYFNEPKLFNALIEAAERGVQIELVIDASPRTPEINAACLSMLKNHQCIQIIEVTTMPFWQYLGIDWHGHMHSKMYYFSHPGPHVLIGSYNPTTDSNQIKPDLIEKIGDHTISHNTLIQIDSTSVINLLLRYFKTIKKNTLNNRFSHLHNNIHCNDNWSIHFLPRWKKHPVITLLKQQDDNAEVKCAISHLKGPGILNPLIHARKKGKHIKLLLDSTARRVSQKQLKSLDKYNILYHQIPMQDQALMHNKFIIYKSEKSNCVMFGSFNWSRRSWWLNHEIIACSYDKNIIAAFEQRWNQMIAIA